MWDDNLRFRRKIPSVLFALLVMLLTCLFHFRSLDIVTPRYLAESVVGKGWSWRVYVLRINTCQPREKFWRDKRGATERSEPTSEGGSGGPPRKISKTYIANGAIYVIPELYL